MTDKENKDFAKELEGKAAEKEFSFENPLARAVSSVDMVIDEGEEDILSLYQKSETVSTKKFAQKKGVLEKKARKLDPISRLLAEPKLPEPAKENRARLEMQSPTRLYFYWSVKNNPFQTLNKAFGGRTGSYSLVVKLINKTRDTEELYRVEPEGNWWFNAEADSDYTAEIGFYAPNRPFVRIMFSNDVRTPRRSPSKRRDYTPSFSVNAYQFAEALDAAGYQRDAFEVAFAGDDAASAEEATQKTYASLLGEIESKLDPRNNDELRFALLALASGYSLEDIRGEINASLFAKLEADIEKLSAEKVLQALKENFDIFTEEFFEEEEQGSFVIGASLVNFPRKIRKRIVPKTLVPKVLGAEKLGAITSGSF